VSLSDITLNLFIGVAAGVIVATVGLMLFDSDKLRRRLLEAFGVSTRRAGIRITQRKQLLQLFDEIFLSYKPNSSGRILLMSNRGGYPEFDPYTRILELAAHERTEIVCAVTRLVMDAYRQHRPEVVRSLVRAENVRLILFDDLTPYNFRIGVNTELGLGFFACYYGKAGNRVHLEGLSTKNPLLLEAIEAMYRGLSAHGTELTIKELDGLERTEKGTSAI